MEKHGEDKILQNFSGKAGRNRPLTRLYVERNVVIKWDLKGVRYYFVDGVK
jgi:hypothetical protein